MTAAHSPGAIKHFRRTPWSFQQTFQTPLKNLEPFTASIIGALSPIQTASLVVDGYVFKPENIMRLLADHSLWSDCVHDSVLEAASEVEASTLLRTALADWLDFLFVPTPKPFVIYADHD